MANCCLKKFASIVILGSVLSFSAMQAKVQADSMKNITMPQKVTNISQNDMNILFNNVDSSKVAKLDSVEMSETRGESWLGAAKYLVYFAIEVFDAFGINLKEWKF